MKLLDSRLKRRGARGANTYLAIVEVTSKDLDVLDNLAMCYTVKGYPPRNTARARLAAAWDVLTQNVKSQGQYYDESHDMEPEYQKFLENAMAEFWKLSGKYSVPEKIRGRDFAPMGYGEEFSDETAAKELEEQTILNDKYQENLRRMPKHKKTIGEIRQDIDIKALGHHLGDQFAMGFKNDDFIRGELKNFTTFAKNGWWVRGYKDAKGEWWVELWRDYCFWIFSTRKCWRKRRTHCGGVEKAAEIAGHWVGVTE